MCADIGDGAETLAPAGSRSWPRCGSHEAWILLCGMGSAWLRHILVITGVALAAGGNWAERGRERGSREPRYGGLDQGTAVGWGERVTQDVKSR